MFFPPWGHKSKVGILFWGGPSESSCWSRINIWLNTGGGTSVALCSGVTGLYGKKHISDAVKWELVKSLKKCKNVLGCWLTSITLSFEEQRPLTVITVLFFGNMMQQQTLYTSVANIKGLHINNKRCSNRLVIPPCAFNGNGAIPVQETTNIPCFNSNFQYQLLCMFFLTGWN